MIAASIIVLILAGLVRAAVGAGAQASHVSRGWAYPLIAALCVTAGPLGHLVMAAHGTVLSTTSWAESGILLGYAVVPWITLTFNIYDWNNWPLTAVQWGIGPALVAGAHEYVMGFAVLPLVWALACILMGVFYAKMLKVLSGWIGDTPPKIGVVALDANRYTEFLLGVIVQGIVGFIRL